MNTDKTVYLLYKVVLKIHIESMIYKNFVNRIFLIIPLAKNCKLVGEKLIPVKMSSNTGQGVVKQSTQLENILFSTSYNIVQDHMILKVSFHDFSALKETLKKYLLML